MSRSTNRRSVIAVWFAVLVAVAGAGALSGVSISVGTIALWFVACVMPSAVMLMIWRGAPPPTVAEVLHAGCHYRFTLTNRMPPREDRLELVFAADGGETLQIKHPGTGKVFATVDALSEFLLVPVFTGRPR